MFASLCVCRHDTKKTKVDMPNRAIIQAARLAVIKTGPSAIRLPPNYASLLLSFSQYNANGHMGPRKFAQHDLPRIAFHNPSLDIKVTRIKNLGDKQNQKIAASLKLVKLDGEEVEVSIQNVHSDEITSRLKELTRATVVVDESLLPLTTTAPMVPVEEKSM